MQTTKLISLSVIFALNGCAVPVMVSMGVGAASVAVNETTGRTATDHIVSAVNGKDCKVSRMGKEDVCQEETAPLKITTTGVKPTSVAELESRYRQQVTK